MRPLIVILGPTASGKTALSIEIARQLIDNGRRAEIVNADSRQIYKYLNIGTAKITPDEMRDVPHHLFSILNPKDSLSIAWYQAEATRSIDQILDRAGVPILVGGSMLYISSIIDGLQPVAASDPQLRASLEERYLRDDGFELFEELKRVDPESAAAIPRENKVYVIRALEIFSLTGTPKSRQQTRSACPYDLLILGVSRSREDLVKRIDERTKVLLQSGWIDEVRGLLERGFTTDDPGMISHGYREIAQFIVNNGTDMGLLEETIAKKTRQYAKRQMTWWRGDERIVWMDAAKLDALNRFSFVR